MTPEQPPRIRTFIYGSCVSRDTFEFLRPTGYSLVEYVARQSLISAFGPATRAQVDNSGVTSPFQRRMLAGDEVSSLPRILREHVATTDLLLLDLVDERLGVLPQAAGFWTDSVERRHLRDAGAPAPIRLEMGSDRHRQLFSSAARRFSDLLEELSLRHRTALLAPAWAERVRGGGDTPESFGLSGASMNPLFNEYVDILAETCALEVLGADLHVASEPDHRWGLAPFHYDDETYAALADEIDRFSAARLGHERRGQHIGWVTTLRRRNSPSIVTLRQTGLAQITAMVRPPEGEAFAFHLYANREAIEKVHYGRSPLHVFDVAGRGPGPFYVRAFVKSDKGDRSALVSDRLRLAPGAHGSSADEDRPTRLSGH